MMVIPKVWILFGTFLHQDFLLMYPDFFSGIADFAKGLSPSELQEFKLFISEVVRRDLDSNELQGLWSKSESQLVIDNPSAMIIAINEFLMRH